LKKQPFIKIQESEEEVEEEEDSVDSFYSKPVEEIKEEQPR
jgi:hypothetical protein